MVQARDRREWILEMMKDEQGIFSPDHPFFVILYEYVYTWGIIMSTKKKPKYEKIADELRNGSLTEVMMSRKRCRTRSNLRRSSRSVG